MFELYSSSDWLRIDIANNAGKDKLTYPERIKWFYDNESKLLNNKIKSEDQNRLNAGIQAYRAYLAGKPSGYPIGLDATSSGVQILSCLLHDKSGAENCNVLGDNKSRHDFYTHVHGLFSGVIKLNYPENSEEILAHFTRSIVKDPIMTIFYGSTAVPKRVFGDKVDVFNETIKHICPIIWEFNETFRSLSKSKQLIREWNMPDGFEVKVPQTITQEQSVQVGLGNYVTVSTKEIGVDEANRSLAANITHSYDAFLVREVSRIAGFTVNDLLRLNDLLEIVRSGSVTIREQPMTKSEEQICKFVKLYQHTGYLSAIILPLLNEFNLGLVPLKPLRELLSLVLNCRTTAQGTFCKSFDIWPIHDQYTVLPRYGNIVRKIYNSCLYLSSKSSFIEYVLHCLTSKEGTDIKAPLDVNERVFKGFQDNEEFKDVLNSNYSIC